MVKSNTPTTPGVAIGDRVRVPWGLDLLEGTVVGLQGTGPEAHAVISLIAPGSEDDTPSTVVFPVTAIQRAKEGPDRPTGAWLNVVRYERAVADALGRTLDTPSATIQIPAADSGFDIQLEVEGRVVLIVLKILRTRRTIGRLMTELRRWNQLRRSIPSAGLLLITQADLPQEVERRSQPDGLIEPGLGIVRWRAQKMISVSLES